ncbi:MAG: hypothetical protein ACK5QX_12530, partial [bacterium]
RTRHSAVNGPADSAAGDDQRHPLPAVRPEQLRTRPLRSPGPGQRLRDRRHSDLGLADPSY